MKLTDINIVDGLDNIGSLSEFLFFAGRNDIKEWPAISKNNDTDQPSSDEDAVTVTGNFVMNRSATTGKLLVAKAGGFQIGEVVTGGTSAVTANVAAISGNILSLANVSGVFLPGETLTGTTSTYVTAIGGYMVVNTVSGAFTLNETLTGGISSATARYKGISGNTLILDTISGTFTLGETITGGGSSHTAIVESLSVGNLSFTNVTGIFTTADTITGGISGATAKVASVDMDNAELTITKITGKFIPNETFTGSSSAAEATTVGSLNFDALQFARVQITTETGTVALKSQGNPDGRSYMGSLGGEIPGNSIAVVAFRRKTANWAGAVVYKDANGITYLFGTRDLPARFTALDNTNGPKSAAAPTNKFMLEAASPFGPARITAEQVPGYVE